MTKQAIFNKAIRHLHKQNEPAVDSTGCVYRMMRNRKLLRCVVGCFIPKRLYRTDMEKASVTSYRIIDVLNKIGITEGGSIPLLRDLQEMHDANSIWVFEDLLSDIADIAERYGLTIPTFANRVT